MLLILITWYLTGNRGCIFRTIPLFILVPFTAIFIAKTNAKIISLSDAKGVSKTIRGWNKLHHVRTILAVISFLICAVTIVFSR